MYKKLRRLSRVDFLRFCAVGTLGFLINFTLLTVLYKWLDFPIVLAQVIASELSLFNNFMFHQYWTYRHDSLKKPFLQLIIQFHATSWIAIIGSTLLVSLMVGILHIDYIVALVVSSALALFWNFFWTRFAIWKKTPSKNETTEENKGEKI